MIQLNWCIKNIRNKYEKFYLWKYEEMDMTVFV